MSDTNTNFVEAHFGKIPLACVVPSATNPRKTFSDAGIEQLAASIKEHGVRQPILVRPLPTTTDMINPVEIVAGERRYRAAKLAGLVEIPAIVQDLSDAEARELQLVENCQREDVPEIEEADGFERLMKDHGYTADQLAQRIGMSKSHVYARLKLCTLSQTARQTLLEHGVSASVALLVARIPVDSLQELAAKEVASGNNGEPMSYRSAATYLQERYMLNLDRARFSIKDAKLISSAGSCATCPNRTGNQPLIYADVSGDICTDPNCFASKCKAFDDKTLANAEKKGIPVYEGEEAKAFRKETDLVPENASLYMFERPDYSKGSSRPVSELVPEDLLPKPSAFIRVDGKVQAMYERTAMQAALEKAGVCDTEEQRAERNQQRKEKLEQDSEHIARQQQDDLRESAAEQESKVNLEAYLRIRRASSNGLSIDVLRTVLKTLLGQFDYTDYSLPDDILRDVYTFDTSSEEAIWAHIDQAPAEELQLLLMDAVLGRHIEVGRYQIKEDLSVNEEESDFQIVAALTAAAGVSLADIRAELTPATEEAANVTELAVATIPAKGKGRKSKKAAAGTVEPDPASPIPGTVEERPDDAAPGEQIGETDMPPVVAWPFPKSKAA